jgi:hypothetical protein
VKRRPDIIPGMVSIGVAFVATIVLASAVQQCRARDACRESGGRVDQSLAYGWRCVP